jgi:hypothetical protein
VRTRYGLAVALAVTLALGACEGNHSTTQQARLQPALVAYSDGHGLSFTYPATWKLREPGVIAGVVGRPYPLVCLSTELLASCANSDRRLPPNGVGVLWLAVENPPSGHAVALVAGSCSGAQGSASQKFDAGVTRTVYAVACWRGPALAVVRSQVEAMFASVKLTAATYPPCHIRTQTQPPGAPPLIDDSRPCIPPSSGSDP